MEVEDNFVPPENFYSTLNNFLISQIGSAGNKFADMSFRKFGMAKEDSLGLYDILDILEYLEYVLNIIGLPGTRIVEELYLLLKVNANLLAQKSKYNKKLYKLYTQTVEDAQYVVLPELLQERNKKVFEQVEEIIAKEGLKLPYDYYYAAKILQCSKEPIYLWWAHTLAKKAVELGIKDGRYLAANTYDLWLLSRGQLQKYGTVCSERDGYLFIEQLDPATTDVERATWDVKPLHELQDLVTSRNEYRSIEEYRKFSQYSGGKIIYLFYQTAGFRLRMISFDNKETRTTPQLADILQKGTQVLSHSVSPNAAINVYYLDDIFYGISSNQEIAVSWQSILVENNTFDLDWEEAGGNRLKTRSLQLANEKEVIVIENLDTKLIQILGISKDAGKGWWLKGVLPRIEMEQIALSLMRQANTS